MTAAAAAGDAEELVRLAVSALVVLTGYTDSGVRFAACGPLAIAAAAAQDAELVRQAVTALIGLAKDSESGVRDARGRVRCPGDCCHGRRGRGVGAAGSDYAARAGCAR